MLPMNTAFLQRGINHDHAFLPYRRSHEPLSAAEWTGIESALRAEEYAAAAKCGFTHVRLCLGRDFLQSRQAPYAVHARGFDLLFRAVARARP